MSHGTRTSHPSAQQIQQLAPAHLLLQAPLVRLRHLSIALLAALPAGHAFAQCTDDDSANPALESVSSAVDEAVKHDGFAEAFVAAFTGTAHASEDSLAAMKTALSHERGDARDSASALFDLVKDSADLAPCKPAHEKDLLTNLFGGALPADAKKTLAHPAPASNVTVKHYDLDLDLSDKKAE